MKLQNTGGEIIPVPPFDFSKSLHFLDTFTPEGGEQNISELSFTKTICLENRVFGFKLEGKGSIETPILSYNLFSRDKLDQGTKSLLEDRISFFLSLGDNLRKFYIIAQKDEVFSPIIKSLYGLHQVKFLTPFEAAAWAVLSQRISIKVAHTLKERLVRFFPNSIEIEGANYLAFPSPSQLRLLSVEKLNLILKNEKKSEYLMAVAEAFSQVNEEFLRKGHINEVKGWLMNIRGIGEWSAHLVLIRGLGRMEELPEKDEVFFGCARMFYGPETTKEELKKIADTYGDFKGYWAHYLRVYHLYLDEKQGPGKCYYVY